MRKSNKILLWGLIIASSMLLLQLLVLVVMNNEGLNLIDNGISSALAQNRVRFFDFFFVILSYLGETKTIAIFCIILLLLPNGKKLGVPVTILTISSGIINFLIKYLVLKTRPEGLFLTQSTLGYTFPTSYSFPSGHSQTANLFYFSTALLFSNRLKYNYQKNLLIFGTVIFCYLMSFGRIYLGVHFLSDVLAGICLMVAMISVSILIYPKYKLIN